MSVEFSQSSSKQQSFDFALSLSPFVVCVVVMARSMSQVRAMFADLGYMSASYGESTYQLSKRSDSSNDGTVCPQFDVMFMNPYISMTNYSLDIVATAKSLSYKVGDTLKLAVDVVKGVDHTYARCDNFDAFHFASESVSDSEFKSSVFDNGHKEQIIDFEFWTFLTGGVVDHVKYKRIMSKHMYPKFLTCFTENVNFDEVHFPVIGIVSAEKY